MVQVVVMIQAKVINKTKNQDASSSLHRPFLINLFYVYTCVEGGWLLTILLRQVSLYNSVIHNCALMWNMLRQQALPTVPTILYFYQKVPP